MRQSLLAMIAASLAVTACTQMCGNRHERMTPEQVVENYLDVALGMTNISQRVLLLRYTTGPLREVIEAASDEIIREAYIKPQFNLLSYSVMERRDRTPRETEITFQLTYQRDVHGTVEGSRDHLPKITTQNTVSLVKTHNVWQIRDVVGSKTSIDFPTSQGTEIRARPGEVTSPPPDAEEMLDEHE